jgi:hypothetical protein
MIYVAAPYTHADLNVVKQRMLVFANVMAKLIADGEHPVSPLMNHFLTDYVETSFPLTWDYWQEYSLALLKNCTEMYVITVDGWDQSTGVRAEIEMAERMLIPVTYLNPEENNNA